MNKRTTAAMITAASMAGAFALPAAFASADAPHNPAAAQGALAPAEDTAPIDQPQWFVAVGLGLHVAGKASMYGALGYAGSRAAKGVNIWWAGSEPRGAAKASGDVTIDVIFDR